MSVWIVMVFGMCKRHSSPDKNVNAISKLLCKEMQTATAGLMFWLKQKFRKKMSICPAALFITAVHHSCQIQLKSQ